MAVTLLAEVYASEVALNPRFKSVECRYGSACERMMCPFMHSCRRPELMAVAAARRAHAQSFFCPPAEARHAAPSRGDLGGDAEAP